MRACADNMAMQGLCRRPWHIGTLALGVASALHKESSHGVVSFRLEVHLLKARGQGVRWSYDSKEKPLQGDPAGPLPRQAVHCKTRGGELVHGSAAGGPSADILCVAVSQSVGGGRCSPAAAPA